MQDRDLILITAHCPDIKRENLLRDLVISLQGIRGEYDIMISSHTHLPSDITESVEYTYYDSSNKIYNNSCKSNISHNSAFICFEIVLSLFIIYYL